MNGGNDESAIKNNNIFVKSPSSGGTSGGKAKGKKKAKKAKRGKGKKKVIYTLF